MKKAKQTEKQQAKLPISLSKPWPAHIPIPWKLHH